MVISFVLHDKKFCSSARNKRGMSVGFARSVKNGTRGYLIVAWNILLARAWQAWKGLTTAVKYFYHRWACENRSIHGTFAADFDPEVLIVLTENHSTINCTLSTCMCGLAQPEPSLPYLFYTIWLICDLSAFATNTNCLSGNWDSPSTLLMSSWGSISQSGNKMFFCCLFLSAV